MNPTTLEELASKWDKDSSNDRSTLTTLTATGRIVTECIIATRQQCARELREFSTWRPASEPPNHNGTVIASVQEKNGFRLTTFACFMDNRWLREDGSEPIFWIVTHWQELPTPPKGVA